MWSYRNPNTNGSISGLINKSVSEYNSSMFGITLMMMLFEGKISVYDMIENNLSTCSIMKT